MVHGRVLGSGDQVTEARRCKVGLVGVVHQVDDGDCDGWVVDQFWVGIGKDAVEGTRREGRDDCVGLDRGFTLD